MSIPKRPIVGVLMRSLVAGRTEGQGWFMHEVMGRAASMNPDVAFNFYFDRPSSEVFKYGMNVTKHVVLPRATMRLPLTFEIWYQYAVRWKTNAHGCSVIVSPDGFIPVKSSVPTVNVIHDLGFLRFASHLPKKVAKYYAKRYRDSAVSATRLATVSEYSKRTMADEYGISADRISVIPNAAREVFKVQSTESASAVKEKFTSGNDFFVYLGLIQPRKNVANIFRAFDEFKSRTNSDVCLVVVGRAGWGDEEAEKAKEEMTYKRDVHFTGYLTDQEAAQVLGSALSLIYIPHYEGFGMPVIEAMQCGVPVICSNVTSLPEVAGGAAVLVNKDDPDAIASAMQSIYSDTDLRQSLVERGLSRAQFYNWNTSAKRMSDLIRGLLSYEQQ